MLQVLCVLKIYTQVSVAFLCVFTKQHTCTKALLLKPTTVYYTSGEPVMIYSTQMNKCFLDTW